MSQENLLPPTNLPDLSRLHPWSERAAILRVMGGGGSRDYTAQVLLANGVRLLDAAIGDYQLGRSEVLEFHARDASEFAIGYIMRATTHFESCIWHLDRFIKHARALRSLENAESELKELIPKDLSFLAESDNAITNLRNTISHLDKVLDNKELPQGAIIVLAPLKDGLSISSREISWQQLVDWLTEAHKCAEALANFRPPACAGGA